MEKFLKYLFGDRNRFEIFVNSKYNGDYSVKHIGGYLFINPPSYGGAGISYDKRMCGSHKTIDDSIEFIKRWRYLYYGKSDQVKIIIPERIITSASALLKVNN